MCALREGHRGLCEGRVLPALIRGDERERERERTERGWRRRGMAGRQEQRTQCRRSSGGDFSSHIFASDDVLVGALDTNMRRIVGGRRGRGTFNQGSIRIITVQYTRRGFYGQSKSSINITGNAEYKWIARSQSLIM